MLGPIHQRPLSVQAPWGTDMMPSPNVSLGHTLSPSSIGRAAPAYSLMSLFPRSLPTAGEKVKWTSSAL